MVNAIEIDWNEDFFDEVGKSGPVVALVTNVTNQIANAARASAPVRTGAYKAGIVTRVKYTKHRAVGIVEATDPKSLIIESKTGNLARAIKAARK